MPIFLAPMAGGFNTPELVAGVANAGGVGGFGFAYSSPEAIDHALGTAAALTDGPVNANFFCVSRGICPTARTLRGGVAGVKRIVPG